MEPEIDKSFELEESIMKCWNIVDDLDLLCKGVMEKDMTSDQVANVLIGLKDLYNMRFEDTLDLYAQVHGALCAGSKDRPTVNNLQDI